MLDSVSKRGHFEHFSRQLLGSSSGHSEAHTSKSVRSFASMVTCLWPEQVSLNFDLYIMHVRVNIVGMRASLILSCYFFSSAPHSSHVTYSANHIHTHVKVSAKLKKLWHLTCDCVKSMNGLDIFQFIHSFQWRKIDKKHWIFQKVWRVWIRKYTAIMS